MGGIILMVSVSIPKVSKGTWARTIILFLSLVNGALVMYGKKPLHIDNDTINNFVSAAFLIGSAVCAWWKDNAFTKKARIIKEQNKPPEQK
jgi:SPP1 family holin